MYIGTLPLVGQLPPTRSNSWGKQVVVEKRLVICQEGFSDCQLSPTQCMTINDKVKELVDAMNLLQCGKSVCMSCWALNACMKFHLSYMGPEARRYVNYIDAGATHTNAPWTGIDAIMRGDVSDDGFDHARNVLTQAYPHFFDQLKAYPYTIWPVNTGWHWIVIILHITPVKHSRTFVNGYHLTHQINAVIADPGRNPRYESFIWTRLNKLLGAQFGFAFFRPEPQQLFYPVQNDTFSCGFRAYEIMRTILLRINEAAVQNDQAAATDLTYRRIWEDLSWDFQPDKVRAEMTGILATEAMRETEYSARLALMPCTEVRDFAGDRGVVVTAPEAHLSNLPRLSHGPQDLWLMRTQAPTPWEPRSCYSDSMPSSSIARSQSEAVKLAYQLG